MVDLSIVMWQFTRGYPNIGGSSQWDNLPLPEPVCLPTITIQKPIKTQKKWSWGSADVFFGNQDLGFNDPFQIGFSTADTQALRTWIPFRMAQTVTNPCGILLLKTAATLLVDWVPSSPSPCLNGGVPLSGELTQGVLNPVIAAGSFRHFPRKHDQTRLACQYV